MNELSITELAKVARELLVAFKGFTIDKFGQSPEPEIEHAPWAVSIAGRERQFSQYVGGIKKYRIPSLWEIEQYLLNNPLDGTYFGGWCDEEACYLDHTFLFSHKHTAVQEGVRQKQKAIYNIITEETIIVPEKASDTPRSLVANPEG